MAPTASVEEHLPLSVPAYQILLSLVTEELHGYAGSSQTFSTLHCASEARSDPFCNDVPLQLGHGSNLVMESAFC